MAELISTYNVELVTDSVGHDRIMSMLRLYQKAYDACSAHLVLSNTPLDIKSVHDAAYTWMRLDFPGLPAQFVIKVYKDVLAAIRSARSNKHKDFETPTKRHLSARLDKRTYGRFSKEGIEITCGGGSRVRCGLRLYGKAEEMFSQFPTLDPLVFERDGRLFLSIPFVLPKKVADGEASVGVDLGERRLFVTSEGVAFRDRTYLANRRRIRHNRKRLQSKGTKSAKRKLRKLRRRERNLCKDMCSRAANALLSSTEASVIVMEDLSKIKKATSRNSEGFKRKRHNSAMSQVPFHQFKQTVGYKALRQGKTVVSVNPSNTSQKDSRTDRKDGTRKGCRYYGRDGVVLDADYNAAVNIAKRGKHPLSSDSVPLDGTLDFTGQGPVNGPKASARNGARRKPRNI